MVAPGAWPGLEHIMRAADETAAVNPGARSRVDARFTVTPEIRGLLALWKGNVRAVHRELVLRDDAAPGAPP